MYSLVATSVNHGEYEKHGVEPGTDSVELILPRLAFVEGHVNSKETDDLITDFELVVTDEFEKKSRNSIGLGFAIRKVNFGLAELRPGSR